MTYPHVDPDYDTEADFQRDRLRSAAVSVDTAVHRYLTQAKVSLDDCEKCLAQVREVLKRYEPS